MSRHIPRLFIDQPLSIGVELEPDKAQVHHLINVLRSRENDVVHIFNGLGGEYSARIFELGKRQLKLRIEHFFERDIESPIHITLAQGIARGERMDFAIQKAVELGVNNIQPLHTEKSQSLTGERLTKKLSHWRSVVQSATEQSGRCDLPVVLEPKKLDQWLREANTVNEPALHLLLDPATGTTLRQQPAAERLCLLIGPESGLSDRETTDAANNGFTSIRLGPRVLRTETAGLAAIAAIQTLWGDYS